MEMQAACITSMIMHSFLGDHPACFGKQLHGSVQSCSSWLAPKTCDTCLRVADVRMVVAVAQVMHEPKYAVPHEERLAPQPHKFEAEAHKYEADSDYEDQPSQPVDHSQQDQDLQQ